MITVKYFGIVGQAANTSAEEVRIDSGNLEELIAQLTKKHALEAYDFQIAVNRKIVSNLAQFSISDSDEIAFLPAFAGG